VKTLLQSLKAALILGAAFAHVAHAQTPPGAAQLSDSERALVRGSREAILKTGVTPAYFDRHFRVARVVAAPGDRRVVWTFRVGGYEATVGDAVGFYTEGGRRLDAHSVAATLGSTYDITRTITRRRAEAVMRRCIGSFTEPRVEYRAHGGRAALLLTAQRVVRPRASREREEAEERRETRARGQSNARGGRTDEIEEEGGGERPFVLLGAVDLVTGRCEAARARATP
jgi:hypothetical protein